MNKKFLLIPAVLVVGVGVALAQNHSAPQSSSVKPLSSQAIAAKPSANTADQSPVSSTGDTAMDTSTTTTDQPTQSPSPTTSMTTTNTKTTLAYGEDPNNPGTYIVFDKTSVMTDAGISSADQSAADRYIALKSDWRYHVDSSSDINLCAILPIVKMATAGSDYKTNPVTQLKWCDTFIKGSYGSWQKAYDTCSTELASRGYCDF